MPGDWKMLQDAEVIRQNPRADFYKTVRCDDNPHHAQIDEALDRALKTHRLGSLHDLDHCGTLGDSIW